MVIRNVTSTGTNTENNSGIAPLAFQRCLKLMATRRTPTIALPSGRYNDQVRFIRTLLPITSLEVCENLDIYFEDVNLSNHFACFLASAVGETQYDVVVNIFGLMFDYYFFGFLANYLDANRERLRYLSGVLMKAAHKAYDWRNSMDDYDVLEWPQIPMDPWEE